MKVKEIYEYLDSISPFSLQEEWDNSGLNVGDFNQKVEKIFELKCLNKISYKNIRISRNNIKRSWTISNSRSRR